MIRIYPDTWGGGRLVPRLLPLSPNPSVTLRYEIELPRAAWLRVSVFDAGGRLVGRLLETRSSAGRYAFRVDALRAGLRSGVFYLGLDALGIRQTEKVVIIE